MAEGSVLQGQVGWGTTYLSSILDQLNEAVVVVDGDFRFVYANSVALAIVRITLDQLVGLNHWEFLPQLKETPVWEAYHAAMEDRQPRRLEYQSPLSGKWYESRVFPSGDGLVFHLTDITARRLAEAERAARESQLQAMVDSIPQIAWSSGPDRVPTHLNRRWFEYTGLDPVRALDFAAVVHPQDLAEMENAVLALEGKPFQFEARIRRKDGAYRWHLVRNEPHLSNAGEVIGYFGTSTDVHDLKMAEELLQATTDSLPALVVRLNPQLRYMFCNHAYLQFTGRTREEVLGRHIKEIAGEAVFANLEPLLARAFSGEKIDYEAWTPYEHGSRYMRGRFAPSFDDEGRVDSVIALIEDATEARLASEGLQTSEERFRRVIEVGVVPMAFFDLAGLIRNANDAFLNLVGFSRAELESGQIKWSELTPPEWKARTAQALKELEATGRIAPYEKEYFRKDGSRFWGLFGGAKLDEHEGLFYVMDISDRKKAEEAAQDQLRITRTIAENANSPLLLLDQEGRTTFANPAFSRVTGYDFESLNGKTPHELIHSHHPDGSVLSPQDCPVLSACSQSIPLKNHDEMFMRKDGSFFPAVVSVAPLLDNEGVNLGCVMEFRDVTEERARERSLTFLARLREATRETRDPDQIMRITALMLGQQLSASRCAYCEVLEDQETLVNMRDWSPEWPSIEGFDLRLSQFGPFVERPMREGRTLVAEDVQNQAPPKDASALLAIQIKSIIACPLLKEGRLVAIMAIHSGEIRAWQSEEIDLVKLVTERCWAEIERARAERGLRQSEARLRKVLEAATIGVVVNDRRGRFSYANKPLLEMLGYREEDLKEGRLYWSTIQAPDRIAKDDLALEQLRSNGSCAPYETELVRKDGQRVPVYMGAAFIPDEGGEGLMGAAFVTDLTPLKAVQDELERLNAELDLRVRERTSELHAANQALETYSHHVAHDLRAPLRAIAATSRMLEEDFGAVLPKEAHEMLKRQDAAANRLGQLIDDLLKISRLSREEMARETIDISETARSVAADALSAHPDSKVQVEVQEGLTAKADPRLIRLALLNLIENAVKYSPRGGTVHVGQSAQSEFYVRDEGIGFDMAYADKIFEPFERLHRNDQFKGTGIGLSNVKQVVARHGGRVRAESEPGKGATFYFTIGVAD